MPIYEYMCRSCGTRNEFLEGVTSEKVAKVCVECGGTELSKLVSMAAFSIASSSSSSECACESGGGGGCGCGGGGCCGHHN
jgi:putative FmdB family regulatory protein